MDTNFFDDLLGSGVRSNNSNEVQPQSETSQEEAMKEAAAIDRLFILKGDSL